ncbi:MAG: ASCH domain-containing protein, partial [Anaerolineae bacterium]
MNQEIIEAFWRAYLATLPADAPAQNAAFVAESFGDHPDLADELAALVLAGVKTATCSALWEWEAEGASLP